MARVGEPLERDGIMLDALAREVAADRAEQPIGELRVEVYRAQRERCAAAAQPRARRDRADRRPVNEVDKRARPSRRPPCGSTGRRR